MLPRDRLAGIVLAGGASRRMGRDKATLTHPCGLTMVQRTVAVLANRCAPVFVVAAAGQTLPDLPADILYDEVPGRGPLPAVGLGLRAAARAGCKRAVVCAVDLPGLAVGLIDELVDGADAEVVLPSDGRDHYLAAVYSTALADRVGALVAAGERRMRMLTDRSETRRVVVSEPCWLVNMNEPVTVWEASDAGSRDQPRP